MSIKKLWTKLFTQNDEADEIELHVSGATVRHRNPFESIEVPRNSKDLSEEFIEKWVVPFYMNSIANADDSTTKLFADAAKEITIEVVKEFLGDFDWRAQMSGAFFSAINDYKELQDVIGTSLLKSEVCYAGGGYCLALATFATGTAQDYLLVYLDYYLDRTDLWFDQADAFCALEHLDKAKAEELLIRWNSFAADKGHQSLEKPRKHFNACLSTLNKIRKAKTSH